MLEVRPIPRYRLKAQTTAEAFRTTLAQDSAETMATMPELAMDQKLWVQAWIRSAQAITATRAATTMSSRVTED